MNLARLHRWSTATWLGPLALGGAMFVVQCLGPDTVTALRYDRVAVLGGEAWRLVTGHLVHADFAHLGWNLGGLALVGWLFGADYGRGTWLAILAASTAAIDVGFLLLQPQLAWYVGFSGALHGLMAAGMLCWVRRDRDWITVFVFVLFVSKLAWEQFAGPLPFTATTLTVPIVVAAHTYGALGGAAAALWVLWRRENSRTAPV